MIISGKILLFNPSDGSGLLITSDKNKFEFSIREWEDFDTMPSLGLDVKITFEEEKITSISSVISELKSSPVSEKDTLNDLKDSPPKEEPSEEVVREGKTTETEESAEQVEEQVEEEVSITMTMTLQGAIANYFDGISKHVIKRQAYKKLEGRLNYLLVRRFLWTTFNNLSEIDLRIIIPKVKSLSEDLKAMSDVYDDFIKKVQYPSVAYEEVFLACQVEYLKLKEESQEIYHELNKSRNSETHIFAALKSKKEEIIKHKKDIETVALLKKEYRVLNGKYADTIHLTADLDSTYKRNMLLLNDFEKEFKNDFKITFADSSLNIKRRMLEILDAQAYLLDDLLWAQARSSRTIKINFQEAGIKGDYSTKTYLKYYLDGYSDDKITDETKKLYELYEYLSSLNRHIMIMSSTVTEAMRYEKFIKKENEDYNVKSFLDEKAALKWAIKHSVKVLVVEEDLVNMHVEIFLKYYKKNIISTPKILILGNAKSSDDFIIHKLLPSGASPAIVANNVRELLELD